MATAWVAAGVLPRKREAQASEAADTRESGSPTATVWQGYPVCDSSGALGSYVPQRRVGSADKLPSIYWST